MILFYSTFCNHCTMLIDNIKRYDVDKKIKLVSIDELLAKNINIEDKIHSVPAFMILPSKELLFGKEVFDHLLLPGRGLLYQAQNTRLDNKSTINVEKTDNNTTNNTNNTNNTNATNSSIPVPSTEEGEPLPFTLKSFNFSDNFSPIDDCETELKDKNYNWDFISNDKNITDGVKNASITANSSFEEKKDKLPSLEEIQKMRDNFKY